jgi:hypothetical protein
VSGERVNFGAISHETIGSMPGRCTICDINIPHLTYETHADTEEGPKGEAGYCCTSCANRMLAMLAARRSDTLDDSDLAVQTEPQPE